MTYQTEDQIERAVERKVDSVDAALMNGAISIDQYHARMREIDSWADEAMAAIKQPVAIEIGVSVSASGYPGTIVGVAPSHPSYGYIPEGMVVVRLPGGVRLASISELSR